MNKSDFFQSEKWSLPNLLTGFRMAAAPVLLWLAWQRQETGFMLLLGCAFLSDFLDGYLARLTGRVSEFGAYLDSWADVVSYLAIAVGCWLLWPAVVEAELAYVVMVIASCLIPALVGHVKFGRFTSYHTWAVKLAAACTAASLFVLFLGGPAWPLRVAAVICAGAAVEEIAISLRLSKPVSNIRSIWDTRETHVRRE